MNRSLEQVVERLKARREPGPLVPRGPWDRTLGSAIEALACPPAARSALFLWNDDLTRAHELAQEIETPLGSCLHGTMHRREPDYENARYWFRRVKPHPVGAALREAALELQPPAGLRIPAPWDPLAMVNWCEKPGDREDFLRRLQARELELLAECCLTLS